MIEKYIEANGKCPVTGEPLSVDDLLPLKSNKTVKPRLPTATSIPSLIQLFQNEWDAVMLETYTLKEQLNSARQQLAHALYQQDAACRVIARLTRERDEARRALATAQASFPSGAASEGGEGMELEAGISEQIKQNLISFSRRLTAERKQRTIPKETATEEDIKRYGVLSSHPTHSSSEPGILCVDIHPANQSMVLTGGVDKKAVLLNRDTGVVEASLEGHTKPVRDVLFHPRDDVLLTASADRTVRVWRGNGGNYPTAGAHVFRTHAAEVVGLSLHPTADFLASASLDGTWVFHDLRALRSLASFPSDDETVHCTSFHPDGLILGNGTGSGAVRIWDLKTLSNVASFKDHNGKVLGLSFSENGFYLATVGEDRNVKLWDLRKQRSVQTIALEEIQPSCLSFDFSGKYLAVGGDDIRIFGFVGGKALEPLVTLGAHSAPVTDVKFGANAAFLASTSMDRTLKLWAPQEV